jgi:hypothetical protein
MRMRCARATMHDHACAQGSPPAHHVSAPSTCETVLSQGWRGRLLHAPSKGVRALGPAQVRPHHCALHLRHQAAVPRPLTMTITHFCALNMQRNAEQPALSRRSRCASHGLAVWKRAACMHVRVCVAVLWALQVGSASPAAGPHLCRLPPQQSCNFLFHTPQACQLPRPG